MAGGGENAPPVESEANGGEFLLSLLQRSNHQHQTPQSSPQPQPLPQFPIPIPIPIPINQSHQQQHHHQQLQTLALDPAVAAVGPSMPFPAGMWQQSNGCDVLSPPNPWPRHLSPPNLLPGLLGLPQNLPNFQGESHSGIFNNGAVGAGDDLQRFRVSSTNNATIHNLGHQKQQMEQKFQFGSFHNEIQKHDGFSNLTSKLSELEVGSGIRNLNGLERNRQFDQLLNSNSRTFDFHEQDLRGGAWGKQPRMPPPGFSNKPRGGGNWHYSSRRRELDHIVNKEKDNHGEDKSLRDRLGLRNLGLTKQLDHPGPPAGSNLHSVSASDLEESLTDLNAEIVEGNGGRELDDIAEKVDSFLLDDQPNGKIDKKQNRHSRDKEYRSDTRGQRILSQRMRIAKRQMECRWDIDRLNVPFVAIYESLIPPEEEKLKQTQLLTSLEKLVNKEWPQARLYLYGSCANSFGVLKSDIDVCLALQDADVIKSEVLLKLADILQSDNLQNVQALTRARVPIVKLMDPVTGISCDICINNVLAVVNTKLLRDYAQVDVRLRQLAFIVKHWAKSRGVNATYQGTLSSYAYVLMCIHFLQLRRPAILPCLQGMNTTYAVTVDDIECAYFDQVEKLRGFGSQNKETIAQLVWAFFNYWAYRHDYANDVISVRKGSLISKQEKDWTRRIGNDRHLICIEDPFETSHDLGRVVDKYSIKVLREEFERAASIMQFDPNPCATLFEPYVPS